MSIDQLSDQEWLPAAVLPMHKSNFHAQEMILATIYSCSSSVSSSSMKYS